jgi:serine phosphatase RsbU (regulator of sigma subunit)
MCLILVTAFFLTFGYYTQLDLQEKHQYDQLTAIVSTLATSVDGDAHQEMMLSNKKKDIISTTEENDTYASIHAKLRSAVKENKLETAIYTMVFNEKTQHFEFGVTSDPNPYFRHEYKDYPDILAKKMKVGGTIPAYKDEHGYWLSAFHPIKNSKGEVVGVVQADKDFSAFIEAVRSKFFKESIIAFAVIVLLALIVLPFARKILREEDEQKRLLHEQANAISKKNQEITASINYAQKIQNTILPELDNLPSAFSEFAMIYKPKDIVAGDFYFIEQRGNHIYVAAADCTGHGVPGAMVSVICSNALFSAINDQQLCETNKILDATRDIVTQKFEFSRDDIKDGMDISLCRFDITTNELEYSGANSPIYIVRNNSLQELKPCKQPIGKFFSPRPFASKKVQLEKGDSVYMFSDGYADQFGGERGKKLKYKTFRERLLETSKLTLAEQMNHLDQFFNDWKGNQEQVDDVCLLGIRI